MSSPSDLETASSLDAKERWSLKVDCTVNLFTRRAKGVSEGFCATSAGVCKEKPRFLEANGGGVSSVGSI